MDYLAHPFIHTDVFTLANRMQKTTSLVTVYNLTMGQLSSLLSCPIVILGYITHIRCLIEKKGNSHSQNYKHFHK